MTSIDIAIEEGAVTVAVPDVAVDVSAPAVAVDVVTSGPPGPSGAQAVIDHEAAADPHPQYVKDDGDTMTGNLTIAPSGGEATLQLGGSAAAFVNTDGAVGQFSGLRMRVAGLGTRWMFGKNNTAEAGSNAGSDFVVRRYSDAGATLGDPITITRSSGLITASGAVTTGGDITLAPSSGNAYMRLRKSASALTAGVIGGTGANNRWMMALGNATAESGANAGSDFALSAYNDAGGIISTPFTISRATGDATFTRPVAVGAPTANGHAATKQYADGLITAHNADADPHPQYLTQAEGDGRYTQGGLTQATGDARYLKLTGGSVSGPITLPGDPTLPAHATTKAYLDSRAPSFASPTNTGYGANIFTALSSGTYNSAYGYGSLMFLTTGSTNTGYGSQTLRSLSTGAGNTAVGSNALFGATSGNNNVAVGASALYSPKGLAGNATTTQVNQTAIGVESGQYAAGTADYITTVGWRAVAHTRATAVGAGAEARGAYSVAIGFQAIATVDNQMMLGTSGQFVEVPGLLRLPHRAAPATPVDGDVWTTSAGMYARINGATQSVGQDPYWHGGYTGALSVPTATVTTVPIVLTGTNQSAHTWVVSGGYVTVPAAGFYVMTAIAQFGGVPWSVLGTPKRAFLQLTIVGSARHGRTNYGPMEDICCTGWSCYLAAGAQIMFTVFQDTGNPMNLVSCEVGISGIPA